MIRKLNEDDLKDVNRLIRNLYNLHVRERKDIIGSDNRKYSKLDFIDLLVHKYNILLGAEEDHKLVGLCIADVREYSKGYKLVFITNLIVDKEYQCKGIGKALIEEAKKEGKLRGAKRLELSVYNFNENAMGFYKKIGLTPLRTVMEVKI